MHTVRPCTLPAAALLQRHAAGGGYADCYQADMPGTVSQAAFVEAFYTTRLFKLERVILSLLARRPSTDGDVKRLAEGSASTFAAWRVEGRSDDQLLLGDFTGRTKSWLMTAASDATSAGPATRLYFGSAVVPKVNKTTGHSSMGFAFTALLGFHRLYSRLLLRAAVARLRSQ
ncbi:MAG: hypothetical protein V4757_20400 [Pseudomonadota bacterium]